MTRIRTGRRRLLIGGYSTKALDRIMAFGKVSKKRSEDGTLYRCPCCGYPPKQLPDVYAPGSKDEAVCFAADVREAWLKHGSALKWLEAQKVK